MTKRLTEGRLRRAAADVKALGAAAPLRAGYELSKRAGGHRVVFAGVRRLSRNSPALTNPFKLPALPKSEETIKRCLADADRIASGRLRIFGRELELGDPPHWHVAPDTGGRWPDQPWWTIDLRSEDRVADVKWTWEVGRHRHLVVLARASAVATDGEVYRAALERHLSDWLLRNPPEQGVHWYSNLELALRAVAWLQVLELAGDRLPSVVLDGMKSHLWHTGNHLTADLPYTATSMRNNHLLGDALGLMALGAAFGRVQSADRWWRWGQRLFRSQLKRHMHADGSMIEDSLSYHRFVLEMLVMRNLLEGAGPQERQALLDAAQFLCRLGVLDGPVPQYGDWDEGRVLASSDDPSNVAGSTLAALSICGDGAPADWQRAHDECAWYAPTGTPVSPDHPSESGSPLGGGHARTRRGDLIVWLKGGSGPSHGHADLSHISVRVHDDWLIGDPGTGTYNGRIEQRNYFRGGSAHNVLRLSQRDIFQAHRAFRWLSVGHGVVGSPIDLGNANVMWCAHDAYGDLIGRIARVVLVADTAVVVTDFVESPVVAELSMTLHPGVCARADGSGYSLVRENPSAQAMLQLPGLVELTSGQDNPFKAWWSDTYGSMTPTTRLDTQLDESGPVVWSLGLGGPAKVNITEGFVETEFAGLSVHWRSEGPTLRVEDSQVTETSLSLPHARSHTR